MAQRVLNVAFLGILALDSSLSSESDTFLKRIFKKDNDSSRFLDGGNILLISHLPTNEHVTCTIMRIRKCVTSSLHILFISRPLMLYWIDMHLALRLGTCESNIALEALYNYYIIPL